MDQRCRRSNWLTPTTVAKFQASSIWDPQDDPSKNTKPQALSTWDPRYESFKKAQDKPPHLAPTLLAPTFLAPTFLAPTFLAIREWQDLWQENSEGEKETLSSRAGSEGLQPSHRCQCVQRVWWGSQRPESYHLFQLWPEGSLCH